MPIAGIAAWSPGDAFFICRMQDLGAAGGNTATIRIGTPFRGYVKAIGLCPEDPPTGGSGTTISVTVGSLSAMTATELGILIPTSVVERGFRWFNLSSNNPRNFFEKNTSIAIASGGETTVANLQTTFAVVLGRL